jgi:hypothetical protein
MGEIRINSDWRIIYVRFKSFLKSNGKYVSFEPNGRVVADRTSIGAWEKFILYNGGDNRIYVLQALSNGRYISANGGRELTATSYVAGSWERFVIVYF